MTKEKSSYGDKAMALIHRAFGQELKPWYPPEDALKILGSVTVDYVPLWARKPHNLGPLPCPPETETPVPMVDEALLPELITTIHREKRRFGYKIARVSIGARPAAAEKPAALQIVWEAA